MADSFNNGVKLYKMRNYKEALAVFLSLSQESDISNIDMAYYIGLSYARLNRFEESLLYLEQVVTGDSSEKRICQCRLTLAVVYIKTGRPRLADRELQFLIENGYKTSDVLCALAYTCWIKKEKEKCIEYYEKALEIKPESSTALNGLGYVLASMNKDLTKALSLCKKAVDKNPESAACLDSLSFVYFNLGLQQEAINYIKRAYQKDPENPEIKEHYHLIVNNDNVLKNDGIRGYIK